MKPNSKEKAAVLGLAMRIVKGQVEVNGQLYQLQGDKIVSVSGEEYPPKDRLLGTALWLPQQAVVKAVGDAQFTIHPVLPNLQVGKEYAEVHGQDPNWYIRLADTSTAQGGNPPISFLHFVPGCPPPPGDLYDLQVNEGVVRIGRR
jgi:hypothetical protein